MDRSAREAFREQALAKVLACVRRHEDAGEGFPSARRIREQTGLSSLATVHRYVHLLAARGEIRLPEDYPPARDERRVLAVQRKRLRLSGGDELLLSLVVYKSPDGQVETDVTRVARPGKPAPRVLSCTDCAGR